LSQVGNSRTLKPTMPSSSSFFAAAALGVLCGALGALWITLAEAQGLDVPFVQRAASRPAGGKLICASGAQSAADIYSPRPTPAPKPVVDARAEQ
jgi:anti-sigma factor RsiW